MLIQFLPMCKNVQQLGLKKFWKFFSCYWKPYNPIFLTINMLCVFRALKITGFFFSFLLYGNPAYDFLTVFVAVMWWVVGEPVPKKWGQRLVKELAFVARLLNDWWVALFSQKWIETRQKRGMTTWFEQTAIYVAEMLLPKCLQWDDGTYLFFSQ